MSFRVQLIDGDALREIAPAALHAYATAQGWRRIEEFGEHSDVYSLEGTREVIIPGTASIADYARAVSDVIGQFARAEERNELQVYRDLSTADQDVIRVRAREAEDDGSVRLESGVDLVVHARDLLLSAACSASDPRAAYRAGRVKEATEYLDRVRLGQTERGSFVVTLLSPVTPTLENVEQSTLWPMLSDEPFERQVTRKLVEGLESTREAVEKANRFGGFGAFEDGVERGVSANLCEAAASLIDRGKGVDVSVTWARTRPTPEKRKTVGFTHSDADVLKEAARLFRNREPRPDERLEGVIVKLVRREGELDGRITLRAFVDQKPVSVNLDLPQKIYEEAVKAHQRQLPISIKGDLQRDGSRWRLRNPRELICLDTDDDSEEYPPVTTAT